MPTVLPLGSHDHVGRNSQCSCDFVPHCKNARVGSFGQHWSVSAVYSRWHTTMCFLGTVSPCLSLSLSDFELESSPHGRWLKICRFLENPLSWWRSNRSNGRTRTPRSHSCDKRFRQRSARATSVVAERLSRNEQWREWVTKYRVYVGSDFDCNRIFDAS